MEKRDPAVRFDLVARLWMVPVDHGTPCLVESGLWCRITLLIDVLLEVADTSFTVVFFRKNQTAALFCRALWLEKK
jgi:hypothetical protein